MWQWPILEQKEEQGSLSWASHLWPVKPEGQVQEKLGAKGEGRLGEAGRAGSKAWQLPPFWQSWASWQGSGNWHVSPRKPGAHLSGGRREEDSHHWALFAFSPTSLFCFPFPSESSPPSLLLPSQFPLRPALPPPFPSPPSRRHTHWQVPCPSDRFRQVPPLAQGSGESPQCSTGDGMRVAWDRGALCSPFPPLGALGGSACRSSTHVLLTTLPSVPGPHVLLLPQHLPPQSQASRSPQLLIPAPFPVYSPASQVQPQAPSLGSRTTGLRRGAQGTPGR